MRMRIIAALGGLLLWGAACAPRYDIHTISSPDAHLAGLRTFRMLPVPARRDGRSAAGAYDPMVSNSITGRELRDAIARALVARGWVADERAPDLLVAVYASASEELDMTMWDYGYPRWPGRAWPAQAVRAETYTAGTVVVDVVHPASRELLWRGAGTERMTLDPARDARELQKVAVAIVRRFPRAAPPLASR